MATSGQPERPSELVYLPEPSWAPVIAALGLALIVGGLAVGWVLSVIGALFFIPAVWSWIGSTRESVARLPRRQRPVTAVVPPVTRRTPASE
jgi:hypothetical protein